MVTETRTVEVPVEVYKPVPATLTNPIPYPPSLPENYKVRDMIDLIFALYDAHDQFNEDRADVVSLTQPGEDNAGE